MRIESYSFNDPQDDWETYAMIRDWAPEHFPQPEMLPKLGVIVYDGEEPVCFLCADMSNNIPRAFIDHLQTNPEASRKKRFKAVTMAEEFLCHELRELGYSIIIGISRHAGVAFLSQRMGYEVSPQPFTGFTKLIA